MLAPERWQFVKEAFHAARGLSPVARATYLASVCGPDDTLNSELAHLLTANDRVGPAFLDSPLVQSVLSSSGADALTAPGDHRPRVVPVVGSRVAHYTIEAELGSGGMGTVYRAWDVALGRSAALKMLSASFTPSVQQRLRREAEACARLQHPAIATFFESGESEGGGFIAMELVEGETLRARLRRGPLATPDALAIAGSLLEALSHAHSVGILHRDIKPENIMVTGLRSAKLLDFGLAKDLAPDASLAMTETLPAGTIVGTVGYMSPEQITGGALDVRTDVFQVGAVLYEALSGRQAFPGATVIERLAAVLARDPDPLGPEAPGEVVSIVRRALQRELAARYDSASAFLLDLRRVMDGEPVDGDVTASMAVLEFENGTGNLSDAWIGTGIAETIAADMAQVSGVRVLPRERVLAAAGQAVQPPAAHEAAVGRVLGCRWVMGGRFQRLGDALRVTMRLVDAPTGRTVATESCDGYVSHIFELQDRVVKRALDALALEGSQQSVTRPALSAYEMYARGRRLFLRLEKGSMEQARSYYDAAVAAEPDYAAPLAGLAGFHAMRYTFTTDRSSLELAAQLARRAIAADATSADARNWLGYALLRLGEYDDAAEELRQAQQLQPQWFFPHYFGAAVDVVRRRPDDALRLAQCAVALEPMQSFPMWFLACVHTDAGRYDEAVWCFERSEVIEHAGAGSAQWAGLAGYHAECLRRMGRLDAARRTCLEALAEVERSDHMYRDSHRGVCLVTLGRIAREQDDRDAARAAYRQALEHLAGRDRTLAGGFLAVQAYAGLAATDGDRQALDAAHRLYTHRERFNFAWLFFCWEESTLLDLARAESRLGNHAVAEELRARALRAGSFEARGPLR